MKQNKIYIGNLLSTVTQSDIETEFSRYGELDQVQLITDRMTGASKGFAFLTFTTQIAAETALKMNGKSFNGRNLVVNMAKEKPKKNRRKRY
ncbi:MAG: RNA-binding protein [Proteobacteria bacterium]|nr:RNA-binding protein [Pseudomonadota bacterium]